MMKTSVFGSTGLLGSEITNTRPNESVIYAPSSLETNLLSSPGTWSNELLWHDDLWINCAARVGGVKANMTLMSDFYQDNIKIGGNVIEAACKWQVKKLISVLSTCVYPDSPYVNYPLTEDQLHNGPPHHSNFGYAYAKRMLDVQSRAARIQHGSNFITVVPNNLYGPNDNYNINSGHVIPSLIRKFYEAHLNRTDVIVWGTGKPLREFTFARDAAKIIWWLSNHYNDADPINIGNNEEVSIGDLASLIGKIIGFKGQIKFDLNSPEGQFRKPSSNAKLRSTGIELNYTTLEAGLVETIEYFVRHYPNVRGIK